MKRITYLNGSPCRNGATDELLRLLVQHIGSEYTHHVCNLRDFRIAYCMGCKACYNTGVCAQNDDMPEIIQQLASADVIVTVSPSYWADITGQMKVFFDRCTPYCALHTSQDVLTAGKIGFAAAIRTGHNPSECLHIIESINHFYGHMEIVSADSVYLCGIQTPDDIRRQDDIIKQFATQMKRILLHSEI